MPKPRITIRPKAEAQEIMNHCLEQGYVEVESPPDINHLETLRASLTPRGFDIAFALLGAMNPLTMVDLVERVLYIKDHPSQVISQVRREDDKARRQAQRRRKRDDGATDVSR